MTINPGNSGGPLCSEANGTVVGIVNARIEEEKIPTGIGCAIPANLVTPAVDTVQGLTRDEIEGMKNALCFYKVLPLFKA